MNEIQLLLILCLCVYVAGHGRLMDPPARNSAWRYGFDIPVNYGDNELFCGGYAVMIKNNGKCGVCGDNAAETEPRSHEAGGKYGKGTITKRYAMGEVIEVEVDITANHYGHFEFKLCPHNNRKKIVTQECLDSFPLEVLDPNGEGYKFIIPKGTKKKQIFKYEVKLPEGVTCSHCVLQWTYRAGNTWGTCNDGTEEVGCGPQETFVNCADIAIFSSAGQLPAGPVPSFRVNTINRNVVEPLVVRYQTCLPSGLYRNFPGMNGWCRGNCLRYPPNCPRSMCSCWDSCTPIGEFAKKNDSEVFCNQFCFRYHDNCPDGDCGPYCPYNRCMCSEAPTNP